MASDPNDPVPPPLPGEAGASPPVVPGPLPVRARPDGLAIASLVCGILSLCTFCIWCAALPLGISGIVCGYVSKDRSSLRTAGLVCSIIGTLIGLVLVAIGIIGSVAEY